MGGWGSGCDYNVYTDSHGDSNQIDKLHNIAKVYIVSAVSEVY